MKRAQNSYKRISSKYSDDSGEETELFTKTNHRRPEIPVVEKIVEEGDTLQSLSIRYNCTISILKRINNIHNENEIFAKHTIKVPHRPFSEALAPVHTSGTNSPDTTNQVDPQTLTTALSATLLDLNTPNDDVNEIIFNSHVEPSRSPHVDDDCDVIEENVELLPQRRDMTETETVVTKMSCSGDDGDIPWVALVACVVVLIFAVPMIYVFYIYEHPKMYEHNVNGT